MIALPPPQDSIAGSEPDFGVGEASQRDPPPPDTRQPGVQREVELRSVGAIDRATFVERMRVRDARHSRHATRRLQPSRRVGPAGTRSRPDAIDRVRGARPDPGRAGTTADPTHTADLDRPRVGHGETTPCPDARRPRPTEHPRAAKRAERARCEAANGRWTSSAGGGAMSRAMHANAASCFDRCSHAAAMRGMRYRLSDGGRFDGINRARSAGGRVR